MNDHPILVRNIQHLTDARYFAAMEVDWISIALTQDPATFALWHALKEWISGIRLAAEIKSDNETLVAKAIIDAIPDGIITDSLDNIHLTGGLELFLVSERFEHALKGDVYAQVVPYSSFDVNTVKLSHHLPQLVFLEADWTREMIAEIKNSDYAGGFCFTSGEESIRGVRDYSEMDAMIELIKS